jgi:hypothetical protein
MVVTPASVVDGMSVDQSKEKESRIQLNSNSAKGKIAFAQAVPYFVFAAQQGPSGYPRLEEQNHEILLPVSRTSDLVCIL